MVPFFKSFAVIFFDINSMYLLSQNLLAAREPPTRHFEGRLKERREFKTEIHDFGFSFEFFAFFCGQPEQLQSKDQAFSLGYLRSLR